MKLFTLVSIALCAVAAFDDASKAINEVFFSDRYGNFVSADPLVPCVNEKGSFTVKEVVLTPYPIISGGNLKVSATGDLKSIVTKGAFVRIDVKAGTFTLFSKTVDLCEEAAKDKKPCPLTPGVRSLSAERLVPGLAPDGEYSLEFHVYNADKSVLACLAGTVKIIKKN